ncbi:MAG: ATP-binding protein, partial [Candidatus Rokuibacteriota bacterium]
RWDRRPIALLRIRAFRRDGVAASETARALETAIEKVRAFGGRVDGLSASGLVGAFGIDRADDAAWRAANSALAIQNAAGRSRVELRFGIHAGTLMVGRSGRTVEIDQDAKRDALVGLDRLLDDAEPGSILINAAAAPFLDRRCELVAAAGDAGAYRLAERSGGSSRVGTGFVGRGQELLLLRDCFDAACRGRGRVVAIAGEAGIGKSRLVAEFRRGLPADVATWLDGQCVSFGEHVAFLPVIEIVRRAAGVTESDTPGTIAVKVRQTLADTGLAVDGTAPYLLHLLGVKEGAERLAALSPEAINVRTLELLTSLALAAARRRPLVVVVEDLHWIDPLSAEHLAALGERVPGASILLLLTYRPGRRPAWLARADVTQVALPPLSRDESLSVLQGAWPRAGIGGDMLEAIVAKDDGNPFFLEEMARAVGQGPAEGRPVPDTIHGYRFRAVRDARSPDETCR